MQVHFAGDCPGDNHLVGGCRIGYEGKVALDQIFLEKRPVVVGHNPFQDHAHKVAVGLDHPQLRTYGLDLGYPFVSRQDLTQAVGILYRLLLIGRIAVERGNLYVGAKAHHLVANLLLEADDYRNREYHNGQTQGNPGHGYPYGRRRRLLPSALVEMNAIGNI